MIEPHWIRRGRTSDTVFHLGLVVAGILAGVIIGLVIANIWF